MHPTQSSTKKKKQTNPNPSPAPPPYYITSATPPAYCHTCGRIISSKRNLPSSTGVKTSEASTSNATTTKTAPKFCSDRCKRHKPSTSPASVEMHVEKALVALLENRTPPAPFKSKSVEDEDAPSQQSATAPIALKKKGESRILLPLSILEEVVFGPRSDPERSYGRRRNRAFRGVREDGEWRSVDMEDDGEEGEKTRPQPISTWEGAEDFEGEVEGGVRLEGTREVDEREVGDEGGFETPEMELKRRAGQKKAEEREFVRCVVRRAVVFGVEVEGWKGVGSNGGGGRGGKKRKGKGKGGEDDEDLVEDSGNGLRKCEAVMDGQVVEPSFAKGDWSVRWREE